MLQDTPRFLGKKGEKVIAELILLIHILGVVSEGKMHLSSCQINKKKVAENWLYLQLRKYNIFFYFHFSLWN